MISYRHEKFNNPLSIGQRKNKLRQEIKVEAKIIININASEKIFYAIDFMLTIRFQIGILLLFRIFFFNQINEIRKECFFSFPHKHNSFSVTYLYLLAQFHFENNETRVPKRQHQQHPLDPMPSSVWFNWLRKCGTCFVLHFLYLFSFS